MTTVRDQHALHPDGFQDAMSEARFPMNGNIPQHERTQSAVLPLL